MVCGLQALSPKLAFLAGAVVVCLAHAPAARGECSHHGPEGLDRFVHSIGVTRVKIVAVDEQPTRLPSSPCKPGMSCWPGRPSPAPAPTFAGIERADIAVFAAIAVADCGDRPAASEEASFYSRLAADAAVPPPRIC